VTDLSGAGVRVLLIATATHSGPTLTSVPAVARSVAALESTLLERCGADRARLRTVLDPPDARTMATMVAEEAAAATSVLLLYFVGHGLLGPGGELYLAATSTDTLTPGLAAHQALPFGAVREALAACRAASVVVVLDCCFSGRAGSAGRAPDPVFTLPAGHGMSVLASAERLALAPEGSTYTAFTGALIRLLSEGDPRGPRLLTLDDAYDYVFGTLRESGGPLPLRLAGDRSGDLVLAVNAAQPAAVGPQPVPEPAAGRSPYLSLAAYGVEDAAYFAGRGRLTDALVAAVAKAITMAAPLALVGPSGAGKTSLLQAGLLARLREGAPGLAGSTGWPWVVLTPGEHPLSTLAGRLRAEGSSGAAALRDDPASAADLVGRLLADRGADRLVLVVDQVEELFTLCPDPRERTAVLAALTAVAAADGGRRALVVVALRADYYGHAATYPDLLTVLTGNQFLVGPMTGDELRAAVEEPAATAGLQLDDGLADLVLHDLGVDRPPGPDAGALPLLSQALWATWQRRAGSRLTIAGYRASGGIATAIATNADATYADLDPAGQDAVRRMLPRLVRVDDEVADTVRPVTLAALRHGLPDRVAADRALDRLTAARLVTVDRDTARISHEALLRGWPLLRRWIEADRDWLRVHQQLTLDARAWLAAGRDPSLLYRGSRLATARDRAAEASHAADLEPPLAEFLDRSHRHERRAARRRTAVTAGLAVLLLLALAGGGAATAFQRQAVARGDLALARLVAAEAESVRSSQPSLAKQLSLVAYRLSPTDGAGAVFASQRTPGVLDSDEAALDIAVPTDGRLLAISTNTGIALWDPGGGRLGRIGGLTSGPVAVSPDGQLLAAGVGPADAATDDAEQLAARRDQVRLWSLADPAHPAPLRDLRMRAGVTAVAASPDGRLLAVGTVAGDTQLWSLADPRRPASVGLLPRHGGQVDTLAFAPRGQLLASAGADGVVRLWDLADPRRPAPLARLSGPARRHDSWVRVRVMLHRVAFSPDGRFMLTVGGETYGERPQVYDVSHPRRPTAKTQTARNDTSDCLQVVALAINDNNRLVATGCTDSYRLWEFLPSAGPTDAFTTAAQRFDRSLSDDAGPVLIRPGQAQLLQATGNGVRLYDVNDVWQPGARASIALAPTGLAMGVAFAPGGGHLLLAAAGSGSGSQLWDVTDPHYLKLLGHYWIGTEGQALTGGGIAFSPDATLLATAEVAGHRAVVSLRRVAEPLGRPAGTITDLANGAVAFAFSPDRRLLAVIDYAQYRPAVVRPPTIRLYDVRDPAHPRQVSAVRAHAFRVGFAPDGRTLAGYTANTLLLWDLTDPRHPAPVGRHLLSASSMVSDGVSSPDGRVLAAGDSAGTLWIWRADHGRPTGEPVVVPRAGYPHYLAISPDGQKLAFAGDDAKGDSTVQLWDISHPDLPLLQTQLGLSESLGGAPIAFSPDGGTLAVMRTGFIDLWDTDPARGARSICASIGDRITLSQWDRYVPETAYQPPCD